MRTAFGRALRVGYIGALGDAGGGGLCQARQAE